MIKTLEWTDAGVRFIDQTKLPTEETYVTCKNYEEVADAIRTMIVRGAPAIGVAAAMGVALGTLQSAAKTLPEFEREFDTICNVLAGNAPDGGEPVLGDPAHARQVRAVACAAG